MFEHVDDKKQLLDLLGRTDAMAAQQTSLEQAASISFVLMAESGTIDEVTATEHADLFAEWQSDISYTAGSMRRYNDILYKCVQAHTSQEDWTPDVSASLWTAVGDPAEEFPKWSQPIGAHDAYNTDDKVTHNGKKWISAYNGNVWEPGVFGWDEVTD
jgi:chitodextrinase